MIANRFRYPKDPASIASYLIGVGEPIDQVISVVTESVGVALARGYPTPGDHLVGSDLVADNYVKTTADITLPGFPKILAGQGVAFRLSGGRPGIAYAIRVGFTTPAGGTLYMSTILDVTGL